MKNKIVNFNMVLNITDVNLTSFGTINSSNFYPTNTIYFQMFRVVANNVITVAIDTSGNLILPNGYYASLNTGLSSMNITWMLL
jgi:hypothetical protein